MLEAEPTRLAEILGTFALAGELGRGMPQGHGTRLCMIAMRLANELRLSPAECRDVFDVSLLMHGGCTAGSAELAAFVACDELAAQKDFCMCDPDSIAEVFAWMRKNVAPGAPVPERLARVLRMLVQGEQPMGDIERGCGDVGSRMAQRLGLSKSVVESLNAICERWNGKGPRRLARAAIPIAVRVAHAALTVEVFLTHDGKARAEAAVRRRSGKSLDPEIASAFSAAARRGDFWDSLARPDSWSAMLALEPGEPRTVEAARYDDVALAFADLVDLKSSRTASHCRATADLARRMCTHLGLSEDQTRLTWRAALTHDLGMIGVPTFLLERAKPTAIEEQQVRMHSFFTERLLARIPAWTGIARVAAAHHERPDGRGYPQGVSGTALDLPTRILAVADAFDERSRALPAGTARTAADVVTELRGHDRGAWDPDCLAALARVVSDSPSPAHDWPGRLSEREVEVLRLLARGLSNKEIAAQLFVSPHTVRHHLEHVYAKCGVTSRAGATLFAMENGLLR